MHTTRLSIFDPEAGKRRSTRESFELDDVVAGEDFLGVDEGKQMCQRVHSYIMQPHVDGRQLEVLIRELSDPNSLLEDEHDVACDSCGIQPICGERFQCQMCDRVNLCWDCFHQNKHPAHMLKEAYQHMTGNTVLMKSIRQRVGPRVLASLLSIPDISLNARAPERGECALTLCLGARALEIQTSGKEKFARETSVGSMEALLRAGADINVADTNGRTFLMKIVKHNELGAISVVNELRKMLDVRANLQDKDGTTALMEAVRTDNIKTVKWIFDLCSDVNIDLTDNCSRSALSMAASRNCLEIMEFLLDRGADVNTRDNQGKTPLFLCGDWDVLKCLVSRGSDLNIQDNSEMTCLMCAVASGHNEKVEYLVSEGASCDIYTLDDIQARHLVPVGNEDLEKFVRKHTSLWTCTSIRQWGLAVLHVLTSVADVFVLWRFYQDHDIVWFYIALSLVALATLATLHFYRSERTSWLRNLLAYASIVTQVHWCYFNWRVQNGRRRVQLARDEVFLWKSSFFSTVFKNILMMILLAYIIISSGEVATPSVTVYYLLIFYYLEFCWFVSMDYFWFLRPYYRRFFKPIATRIRSLVFLWCSLSTLIHLVQWGIFWTAFREYGLIATACVTLFRVYWSRRLARPWSHRSKLLELAICLVAVDVIRLQPSHCKGSPDFKLSWLGVHLAGMVESVFLIGYVVVFGFDSTVVEVLTVAYVVLAAHILKMVVGMAFYLTVKREFSSPRAQQLLKHRAKIQELRIVALAEDNNSGLNLEQSLDRQENNSPHPPLAERSRCFLKHGFNESPYFEGTILYLIFAANFVVLYYNGFKDFSMNASNQGSTDGQEVQDTGQAPIFWAVFLAVFLPIGITFLVWFYIRRNEQPIKIRQPLLSLSLGVMFMIWGVELSVQKLTNGIFAFPCWLTLLFGYCGVIVPGNIYLIRCITLYAKFNLTREMIQHRYTMRSDSTLFAISETLSPSNKTPPLLWWASHQHWCQPSFVARAFTLTCALLLVAPVCFVIFVPEIRLLAGNECVSSWGGAATTLAGYGLTYLTIFFAFSIVLWDKSDAYYIKVELKYSALIASLCLIPWFVLNLKATASWNAQRNLSTLSLLSGIIYLFCASIAYPLFRTYVEPPDVKVETPDHINTTEKLLKSREGFLAFERFLATEFSVQHIYFWRDADEFRRQIKAYRRPCTFHRMQRRLVKVRKCVRRLWQDYFEKGSVHQINIGNAMLNHMTDLYEQVNRRGFCSDKQGISSIIEELERIDRVIQRIQYDVFKMLRNSYRHFRRQQAFRDLCMELEVLARWSHATKSGVPRTQTPSMLRTQTPSIV
eukprot:361654_1